MVDDSLVDGVEAPHLQHDFLAHVAEVNELGAHLFLHELVAVRSVHNFELLEFTQHLLNLNPPADQSRVFRSRRPLSYLREIVRSLVGNLGHRTDELDEDGFCLYVEHVARGDTVE